MLMMRDRMPSAVSRSCAIYTERDLAAGSQEQDIGLAAWRVSEDVGALGQTRRWGVPCAVERRKVLTREDQRRRLVTSCMMTFHASTTSLASAGRSTIRPGIARNDGSCSTGWWVGPSSPTPIESCVKM